ncbi:MAG: hypothetical protein KGH71_04565 [Candidatus Micrarchaeota archaeon]|nr:hypothetical protein [Candidatus Micrarchaeota archaeon]
MKVSMEYESVKEKMLDLGKDRIWSVRELVGAVKRPTVLTKLYNEVVLGDLHYHVQCAVMNEHCPEKTVELGLQSESPLVREAAAAELVRRFKGEFRIKN